MCLPSLQMLMTASSVRLTHFARTRLRMCGMVDTMPSIAASVMLARPVKSR